ncbi:MAG: hypothetical protein ACI31A_05330 [Candidatus Limisoma sp.]
MPEINFALQYPEFEHKLLSEIEKLNDRWKKHLVSITGKEEYVEIFVTDGFYPYYTNQKVKVLFIGKEALEIGGANYQQLLYSAYLENQIGSKTLNAHRFHSTMLYIAYALEKMEYDWHCIPYAKDFIEDFARENGISFAFMNISKFSNESGEWCADKRLIQEFIDLSLKSNENFFGSEIDLLHPDIIIGMNFGDLKNCLGTFSEIQGFYGDNWDVSVYHLTTQSGKEYLYFDTWHFSSPRKSPERDIFNPLMDALRAYSII